MEGVDLGVVDVVTLRFRIQSSLLCLLEMVIQVVAGNKPSLSRE